MNAFLPQETTSTYFNPIIKRNVKPLNVDEMPKETIDNFNRQARLAFPDDGDTLAKRIRYLIPYILQSIDWENYNYPLEVWQLRYYYQRERFLEKTHLDYDDFARHKPLQDAITALELEPEPTFEFILFLKYYFDLRSELRYSPIEQLINASQSLDSLSADKRAAIDINVGGRHYKIENTEFVKLIIRSIPIEQFEFGEFVNDFNQGPSRDKIRALDYYIVKTLLDYLPVKKNPSSKGSFSQAERNFGLSVLNYIGRLPSADQEGVCSRENNATFDKLMRDFRNEEIPFAMELFL